MNVWCFFKVRLINNRKKVDSTYKLQYIWIWKLRLTIDKKSWQNLPASAKSIHPGKYFKNEFFVRMVFFSEWNRPLKLNLKAMSKTHAIFLLVKLTLIHICVFGDEDGAMDSLCFLQKAIRTCWLNQWNCVSP